MKNKVELPGLSAFIKLTIWIPAAILIYNCKSNNINKSTFYYSGNHKIEITIIEDTLGVLLRDTVLNPQDTSVPYFDKIINLANSNLGNQGFIPTGNMENDSHIKLVLNPAKKYTKSAFFNQVGALKSQQNKIFIENAGYLVRVKGTNKPMILTDEIIIQFNPGTSVSDINTLFSTYNLSVIRRNRYDSMQYTVAVTKDSPHDVIKMSHLLKENQLIRFAQINFIYVKKYLSTRPDDEFFNYQWNLISNNPEATEDADIDADLAWDFTMGSENIIIGVIDLGFDTLHYDLEPNILRNPHEIPGNDRDDDENGYKDDFLGWNFDGNDNNLDGYEHGTAVLGVANAVVNNGRGISGSCPKCKSLPIKSGHEFDQDAHAFDYARERGAKIINCSWEYGGAIPPNVIIAINRAISAGIVVIFAMSNSNLDYCITTLGLDELSNLITVSRSTSKDSYDRGGWGKCLSLLAPSGVRGSPPGYLKLLTTDKLDWRGYNTGSNDALCNTAFSNADYTNCFWGTSASAPLTAGVAGLILSANNELCASEVKYLLQDCADKIEHSNADYSPQNGKSLNETHGYGRLNAYEAVKIASSDLAKGGRNGIDIFLRDNELDWGNSEKPTSYSFEPVRNYDLSYWKSMDIKVDAPPYEILPPVLNNDLFERLINENPVGGQINKVYVRVRNRGFRTAASVMVKLHWVHAGASLPPLPSDFWDSFPADPEVISEWNSLGTQPILNLEYSGASLATTDLDAAQIAVFDFTAPVHDPSTRNHYCLVALVSSPDDSMATYELKNNLERLNMNYVTTHYNNASHRNYNIETADQPFDAEFFLYNPLQTPVYTKLELSFKGQPIPVIISDSLVGKLIYLKKNEKKLIRFRIDPVGLKEPTEIIFQQIMPGNKKNEFKVIGGINYLIMPSTKEKTSSKTKK